jgi:hypothetical protein
VPFRPSGKGRLVIKAKVMLEKLSIWAEFVCLKKFVAHVITNCEVQNFLFCVLVGVIPCSSCLCLQSLHFGPA